MCGIMDWLDVIVGQIDEGNSGGCFGRLFRQGRVRRALMLEIISQVLLLIFVSDSWVAAS